MNGATITNRATWTVQTLTSALFLFAGASKLFMPLDEIAVEVGVPAALLLFISLAEVAGGLGLILPGLLRIKVGLTPLAAAGLTVIMVGAVVMSVQMGAGAGALFPLVTGLLTAAIAYVRGFVQPHRRRASRRALVQAIVA